MYPFWPSIVEPLLKHQRPKVIVEVGSEAGLNLRNLLRFAAAHGAHVHAIDPKPLFDPDQWTREAGGRLTVHREPSLTALPRIDAADTVFLDGDHNWYTVFHELKAIERRSVETGRAFPMVLLHDIAWPWGRRDLYYDPPSIPEEFRQPYLQPPPRTGDAGYHADFCKATQEGGPRNGVLTAVEDFLRETDADVGFIKLPGFAGLGIIVPKARVDPGSALEGFLGELSMTPLIRRYVEDLEDFRMRRRIFR